MSSSLKLFPSLYSDSYLDLLLCPSLFGEGESDGGSGVWKLTPCSPHFGGNLQALLSAF